MACNCGGRRGANAAALASGGVAVVFRVTHPNGATVDYWDETKAEKAAKAITGATYAKVDARSGLPVS